MVEGLGEILSGSGKSVMIIASADLSHVGPQFGANRQVTPGDLKHLEEEDRKMLDLIVKGDGEAFSQDILKERDKRNVCGYPPIYTFLNCLGNSSGKLLSYDQADNPNGTVTFAAMAFYG